MQMSGEVRTARLVLTPWLCGKSMAVREIEGDQTYDGQQDAHLPAFACRFTAPIDASKSRQRRIQSR